MQCNDACALAEFRVNDPEIVPRLVSRTEYMPPRRLADFS